MKYIRVIGYLGLLLLVAACARTESAFLEVEPGVGALMVGKDLSLETGEVQVQTWKSTLRGTWNINITQGTNSAHFELPRGVQEGLLSPSSRFKIPGSELEVEWTAQSDRLHEMTQEESVECYYRPPEATHFARTDVLLMGHQKVKMVYTTQESRREAVFWEGPKTVARLRFPTRIETRPRISEILTGCR